MPNNSALLARHPTATRILATVNPTLWRGLQFHDGDKRNANVALDPASSFEEWANRTGVPLGPGGHP